jgi:hypothetical protein
VRSSHRFRARLGQPEVPDLPILDESLHRAGDVLDRYVGVDTVLVEQVDVVGLEARVGGLGNLPDVLRAVVQTVSFVRL